MHYLRNFNRRFAQLRIEKVSKASQLFVSNPFSNIFSLYLFKQDSLKVDFVIPFDIFNAALALQVHVT